MRLAVWWCGTWLRERDTDGVAAGQQLRRLCALGSPSPPPASYEGERVRFESVSERELAPFRLLLPLREAVRRDRQYARQLRGIADQWADIALRA